MAQESEALAPWLVKEGGNGQAQGRVLLSSQGDMNLLKMIFEAEENPTWFKFDGNKASVSQFRPGRRNSLENFFASYEVIVKEGLLGGTLSEAWPLLKLEAKNPKLENAGIKQIGGKDLLALKYTPRKGSELKITLFFEPDTFVMCAPSTRKPSTPRIRQESRSSRTCRRTLISELQCTHQCRGRVFRLQGGAGSFLPYTYTQLSFSRTSDWP
jgi:hypothetical protein